MPNPSPKPSQCCVIASIHHGESLFGVRSATHLPKTFKGGDKIGNATELPVDGGEPHVGDLTHGF